MDAEIVEVVFEAKVEEVGRQLFRFKRKTQRTLLKQLWSDNFGKVFHEQANFLKLLESGDEVKISIKYLKVPVEPLFIQNAAGVVIRGVVNDKFLNGFSIRKPYPQKRTFFEAAFKNYESAFVVENELLDKKSPFEISDFVQVSVQLVD